MEGVNGYGDMARLMAKLRQPTAAGGTSGTQATDEVGRRDVLASGSNVRMSRFNDKIAYVQSHPELADAANLTPEESTELLQSTAEKAGSDVTFCNGKKVLFDIYSILALIQDTAQKMRNAERDLRLAQVKSIQSNILAQAELQRTSALTQLFAGIATTAVSATMMAVAIKGAVNDVQNQTNAEKAVGMDAMKEQQNLLADEGNPKLTKANLEARRGSTEPELMQEVDQAFDKAGVKDAETKVETSANDLKQAYDEAETAKDEFGKAGTKVAEAKAKVTEAQTKVTEAETKVANADSPAAKQTASLELDAAKQELKTAEQKLQTAETDLQEVENKKNAAVAKVDEKQKALDKALQDGTTIENSNDIASKYESVVAKYQTEFDRWSIKAADEFKTTGAVSPETAQGLQDAGQKLNYARAVQLDACSHMTPSPTNGSDLKSVGYKLQEVSARASALVDPNAGLKTQALSQSVQMITQLGTTVGQAAAGLIDAKRTELQAWEKQSEEELQQMQDLFGNTQQVIQQAIQLFQSITQKESQSIEEIINGIRA